MNDVKNSNWSEDKRRGIWLVFLVVYGFVILLIWQFWLVGLLACSLLIYAARKPGSNLRYLVKNVFPDNDNYQRRALRNIWLMPILVTAASVFVTLAF